MMGGRIWVKSELGAGAAFNFTIQAKKVIEKERTVPDLSKTCILTIDDDPLTLMYLNETIGKHCAKFDTAASAEEALSLVEKNGPYDINFVDWILPGIDGLALSEKLKSAAEQC